MAAAVDDNFNNDDNDNDDGGADEGALLVFAHRQTDLSYSEYD